MEETPKYGKEQMLKNQNMRNKLIQIENEIDALKFRITDHVSRAKGFVFLFDSEDKLTTIPKVDFNLDVDSVKLLIDLLDLKLKEKAELAIFKNNTNNL